MSSPPSSFPRVASLVLAAGRAHRFGSDKRQARLGDGRSLLQAVLQTQREACADVRVLLRPDDAWGQALCDELGVEWLTVADADQGMGRTLAAGLRSLIADEGFDAALVVLADMPALRPDTVRALIDAFRLDGPGDCAAVDRHSRHCSAADRAGRGRSSPISFAAGSVAGIEYGAESSAAGRLADHDPAEQRAADARFDADRPERRRRQLGAEHVFVADGQRAKAA